MKLLIAGGRDFVPQPHHWAWLGDLFRLQSLKGDTIDEVVSGCAKGADKFGERWAASFGIDVKEFPADWNKHGRSAGYIRNAEMASYIEEMSRCGEVSVAVVLFPGGRGTQSMHDEAKKRELTIYDWRERVE